MSTVWTYPTRVCFGPGAAAEAGAEARRRDVEHVLLVTDRASLDLGAVEEVGTSLKKAKIGYEVFAGVSPIAREREVAAAVGAYRDAEADGVVAVGAEGALEVAKLARFLATHDGTLAEWLASERPEDVVRGPLPPLVAIPTVPGSGAGVRARTAVVRAGDRGHVAVTARPLRPDTLVLDPALAPPFGAAALVQGAFDALAWAVEGVVAADAHPAAETLGVTAIGRLARLLGAPAPDEGDGDAALSRAQEAVEAGFLAALASDAGEGAARSLARALAPRLEGATGLAAALVLPAVLDYNRSARPERLAVVARALGARGDDVETLAFEAAGAVRALRRRAGLPESLADAGVDEEAIPAIGEAAAADAAHRANPRLCGKDDLVAMLRASLR